MKTKEHLNRLSIEKTFGTIQYCGIVLKGGVLKFVLLGLLILRSKEWHGSLCRLFAIVAVGLLFSINVYSANVNAGTSNSNWSSTSVGGTSYTGADNLLFTSTWNRTYNLTSNVECVNLTIGVGTIINLNGYTLTVTGNMTLQNNAVEVYVGNSRLTIEGNLSMSSYYLKGIFTSSSGLVELGGNFTATNNSNTMAGGTSGFAGTLRFTGATAPTVTLNNAPIAIATLDWDCKTPGSLPVNFTASSTINTSPCPPLLTATSLSGFGDVCPGTTIGPNSFVITGFGLTANILLSAVNGYSYSLTSGGTYTSTLSFPPDKVGNFTKTIYVKFSPPSTGTYSGNIVVSSSGATDLNVAVTGNGDNNVSPTVSNPTSANITSSSATLGGNITVEGCSSNSITERGIYYSTTLGFADGTGTKVSETGTFTTGAFTIDVTGLSVNTTYYFKAFATNNIGTGYSAQGTFNNLSRNMYYVSGGGNWGIEGNWRVGSCAGTVATEIPKGSDNVFIQCGWGNTVTIDVDNAYCNNLTMDQGTILNLNGKTLTTTGNVVIATNNQATLNVGSGSLNVNGNLTINEDEGGNLNWDGGTITLKGNFINNLGYGNMGGAQTGFIILDGTSQLVNTNNTITIPKLKQSSSSFTKTGTGTITVSNTFDRNCAPAPTVSAGSFTVTGTTINASCSSTITTGTISGSPFCPGASVSVPFTITGTFNAGNTFTAQLSDASGGFGSPQNIGSVVQTTAGTISAIMPANTPVGSGYRIRVVGNNPLILGTNNGSNLTVGLIPNAILAVNDASIECGQDGSIVMPVSESGVSYQLYLQDDVTPVAGTVVNGTGNQISFTVTPYVNTTYHVWATSNSGGCRVRLDDFPTMIVSPILVTVTDATLDPNSCPDFLEPFNANTDYYNAGSTLVSFKVARTDAPSSDWGFDFKLPVGSVYPSSGSLQAPTLDATPGNSDLLVGMAQATVNVDQSISEVILRFHIVNTPGAAQSIQLQVDDLRDFNCANPSINVSGTHYISAMPAIGGFN